MYATDEKRFQLGFRRARWTLFVVVGRICIMNTLFRAVFCVLLGPGLALAQDAFENPPIRYSETADNNPVSRLGSALASGEASLAYDERFGYLPSLLSALEVPVSSQLLVFSKTSLQLRQISPSTPRAIYFNDDVYVGSVQGGAVLEISAADPDLGAVFYTLDQQPGGAPRIVRQHHDCLRCHATTLTRDLPGHIVRSVFAGPDGQPILKAGSLVTDQTTPIADRWGGWYITGEHGEARHRGNAIAEETAHDAEIDVEAGANRTALPPRVDTGKYLAPHSDLVAMLVLEHQTRLHNLLTEASFETRLALHRQGIIDRLFERDPEALSESSERIIRQIGDKVVDYMIFADEVDLPDPVRGTSDFAAEFAARGPRDSQGRSLRDLDLKGRLFTYPLSFLIYSEQFDGLPDPVRSYIYQRLWNIFRGVEPTPDLLHLTNYKCRAVIEILRETKAGLPAYWLE